ncbi:hypothetical protein ABH926_009563 [Catenulispora sp. GP43]|uniref:hypothetical protein n=1 Tax=Catenulispora sp. GP43 TaxID=3156263 RepID=UPI00351134F8
MSAVTGPASADMGIGIGIEIGIGIGIRIRTDAPSEVTQSTGLLAVSDECLSVQRA